MSSATNARRRVLVAAGFAVRDGRVLMARRPPEKHLGGCWEFPGGKLEPGETPEAALVREFREELGVNILVGPVLDVVSYAYDDFDLLMLLYAASIIEGEPRTLEVAEVGWFQPARAAALDIPPADAPILERMEDYLRRLQAESETP
jgi:8-oxo-dGTP diphosphatase